MMSKILLLGLVVLSTFTSMDTKIYSKVYHANGLLKAEGWMQGSTKVNYWKFYHENGALSSEGHFTKNKQSAYWHYYNEDHKVIKEGHYKNGKAQKWWIFYDIDNRTMTKTQFVDNQKEGFSLIYLDKKLTKVIKYKRDTFAGEWTSVRSFYRDNPNVSIRK